MSIEINNKKNNLIETLFEIGNYDGVEARYGFGKYNSTTLVENVSLYDYDLTEYARYCLINNQLKFIDVEINFAMSSETLLTQFKNFKTSSNISDYVLIKVYNSGNEFLCKKHNLKKLDYEEEDFHLFIVNFDNMTYTYLGYEIDGYIHDIQSYLILEFTNGYDIEGFKEMLDKTKFPNVIIKDFTINDLDLYPNLMYQIMVENNTRYFALFDRKTNTWYKFAEYGKTTPLEDVQLVYLQMLDLKYRLYKLYQSKKNQINKSAIDIVEIPTKETPVTKKRTDLFNGFFERK